MKIPDISKKNRAFTLVDMLLGLTLGLGIAGITIKLYSWEVSVYQKVSDIVFLDHQGVMAIEMLAHDLLQAYKVMPSYRQGILLLFKNTDSKNQQKLYTVRDKKLYIKYNDDFPMELIPGMEMFAVIPQPKTAACTLKVGLKAPYGMKAVFYKTVSCRL